MEKKKRWYILGRIEVAYWIDRLYFARKRAGGIQRRKQKSTHMQKREERRDEGDLGFFFWRIWERQGRGGKKRRIFFRGEGLKRGGRRLREREKRALGEFLVDFLNEIQKKIVDMEITFPGGTSKGCIDWFGDSDYYQKVLFCRPNYNGFKHLWVVIIFI